ncbi:hypothetical protein HPULCUR_005413 [Helicostylum pulchrum]|uniref:Uncharacterized protein n=1 Tax=Helicostylum pulchrum TaxID=562976 RepID=A0ABP9XZ08_9FUNG
MSTYEELIELIELTEDYVTLNGMQRNLIQEAFLIHFSAIFDIPSYFYSLPFLIVGTRSTRKIPSTENGSFSNFQYWRITQPFLADDDNPRTSFRAMYQMNFNSFERLVNDLSQHPVFDLRAHNSIPVYIQVSCAIWRLVNCHLGHRICHMGFGVLHGSYMNFFRRTLIAIEGVYGNLISWPVDQERVQAMQTGFEWPPASTHVFTHCLSNVIGALDGKNAVIESPRVHAEYWRDRKGNFAMKLTAVCDDKCRTHDAAAFKWTEIFTVFMRHTEMFNDKNVTSFENWCSSKKVDFMMSKPERKRYVNNSTISVRSLYILKEEYFVEIVKRIVQFLTEYQIQVRDGLRGLRGAEDHKTWIKLLNPMCQRLKERSLVDRVFVSYNSQANDPLAERDMEQKDEPLTQLSAERNTQGKQISVSLKKPHQRFGTRKLTLIKPFADIPPKIDAAFAFVVGTVTIAGVPFFDQAIPRFKLM